MQWVLEKIICDSLPLVIKNSSCLHIIHDPIFVQTQFRLKQDVLNFTVAEWRHWESRYYEEVAGDLFHCPACQDQPHTIHIDGNAKLFRYKAAGRYDY